MNPTCTFCQIVAGRLPASLVYEDETSLAFMNIRQANPGHVLVIPKTHVETIDRLDDFTAARLFRTATRIARAIQASLHPPGLSVFQANGEASWQEIPHVHLHLLPRQKDDGLLRYYPQPPPFCPRPELDRLAGIIAGKIDT
ncbi:MAG: HIT family protein [Chloroflexota bacterium]